MADPPSPSGELKAHSWDEFSTLSERLFAAEQREAEARRLLAALVDGEYLGYGKNEWCNCCGRFDHTHADNCLWVAAKNFLESKP